MEISIKWNLCRVCLQEEHATQQMKRIFEGERLAKEIFDCSGIELDPSDGLPDKICRKCLITLKHAVSFRTSCRNSQEYFRNVIEKAREVAITENIPDVPEVVEELVEELEDDDDDADADSDNYFFYLSEEENPQSAQNSAKSAETSKRIEDADKEHEPAKRACAKKTERVKTDVSHIKNDKYATKNKILK